MTRLPHAVWSGQGTQRCSMCAVAGPSESAALVQHISDMDKELQAGEGCRVYGDILVRRIEGVIRFSAHVKDFMMLKSTRKSMEEQMITQLKKLQDHHGAGMVEVCPCAMAQSQLRLRLSLTSSCTRLSFAVRLAGQKPSSALHMRRTLLR